MDENRIQGRRNFQQKQQIQLLVSSEIRGEIKLIEQEKRYFLIKGTFTEPNRTLENQNYDNRKKKMIFRR